METRKKKTKNSLLDFTMTEFEQTSLIPAMETLNTDESMDG